MKNFFLRRLLGAICLFVAFVVAPGARAQNFTPGNLVVYRAGDGATALSGAASQISLVELTKTGTIGTPVTLPTANSGANFGITGSGTASSEGALNLSADKRYLTTTGYNAAVGTASVNSASVNRIIARIDNAQTINTTTSLTYTAAYTANNFRSVVSTDGNQFWTGGNGSATTGGVRYTVLGATNGGTQISNTISNVRVVNIFDGQLYVSSSSGVIQSAAKVGAGLPTTTGQTIAQQPGLPTSGGSAYAYVFFDRDPAVAGVDLLYVTDATGLLKYSWDGSTWTARGSIPITGGTTGLTGFYNCASTSIELYATILTSASTGNNAIVKAVDNTAYNSAVTGVTATTIASAGTNYAFRGIAFAPGTNFNAPTAYNVTGGGAYCGTTAVPIGLSNSETGVNYRLYNGSSTVGSTIAGTGSSLTFPAQTAPGTYTVLATNTLTGCTTAQSNSAVVTVNTPTVSNAGASQTISTGGVASLSANTPTSGTGSWSVTSGPSTSLTQFSSTTNPTATFTPAGGAGSYVLTWTISNASCPPSGSTVTITVVKPTVNLSVSSHTASETNPVAVTVTATASAPVVGNQTVDITVSGTGITAGDYILSNTTITIPDGQTIGSVTFTAVDDAVVEGNETATLVLGNPSANIALGGTTSQDITILDGNAPTPVLLASPATLTFTTTAGTASAEQSYVVSATALTAQVTVTASAGVEVSQTSGSGFAPSLTLPQSTTSATIFARLSTGAVAANPFGGSITNISGSLTATVAISGTVNAANQPPTAPMFTDQTGIVAVPFSYTVPAFTDPESQTLSYAITGLPTGLVADNISLVISGTPTTSSTSTVTVVATDPQSASTAGTFNITINANAAPVATAIANQTATVGTAFSFTVPAFTDSENQTLTYAATGVPAPLTFDPITRVISGTPTAASVSTIVITATDPASNTVSATFSLTVNAAPAGLIRITEFMYNSPVSAGSPSTAGEFVELTNVGNAPVDLTGWSLDDNHRTPGLTSLSSFSVVNPGESVIITEATAADFRTFWFLPTSVKVLGSRTGNGFGNGDEINLYDNTSGPGSSTTTTPADRLTYPSSGTVITNGVSAWTTRGNLGANNISGWQLSVQNDAQNSYRSTTNNLGNPGGYYIPLNRVLVRETGSTPGTTVVAEGGATDTYTVALNSQPTADVTITVTPGSQLSLNTTTLTFTPANYSTVQTVTVTAIDDAIVNGTRSATITQSATSSDAAYNGIAINPVSVTITDNDVAATAPPAITVASTTTKYLSVPATGAGFVSGVISDPTDPASTLGIDFTLSDADTPVNSLTTTLSTNNSAVVPIANLGLTGTGASRNLKVTPVGVGYATLTLAVTDGVTSVSYVVNYAASAASGTTASTRFHTGTSDASTAVLVDANYTLVGDDENQVLRLYNRQNSGLPVAGFDFTSSLGLTDIAGGVPREVDLEASVRQNNRIFWLGSESNADGGNNRPDRDRVFATDVTGSGATTTLSYVGRYDFLKEDIINWDVTNGHGKGANYYGLQASATAGVGSKQPDGYNIEGAEFAPDNSTVYLAFRAPQVPTANRIKALVVPVTNLTTLIAGQAQGSATFGAPIELNLGGRGIREIRKNAASEYLIIAGPAGDATGTAPADFRLFTWTGNAADLPVERNTNLTALNANGSFESIVEMPASLTTGAQVQLLVDNGDAVYYNDGKAAKDLSQNNFKKFRSELVSLGAPLNTAPTVANAIPPQSATVNQAFSYTIPANTFADAETPNSLTLSVAGLPASLSLTGSTISGTPSTTVGSPYSVTVTATDPGSLSVSTVFSLSVAPAPTPVTSATGVVISQVYGGGGNSGATYQNDFVELFNQTNAPININGWSVQYASPTGTGSFSANVVSLSGTIGAGKYYLIQLASNAVVGSVLPTADATGGINMGAGGGKVALVNSTGGLPATDHPRLVRRLI